MEKFNETQPQDGNQIVINKNTGDIHVTNYSRNNDATLERLFNQIQVNNETIKTSNDLIKGLSDTCLKMIEKERKRKSK